jgi:hypothetical protein
MADNSDTLFSLAKRGSGVLWSIRSTDDKFEHLRASIIRNDEVSSSLFSEAVDAFRNDEYSSTKEEYSSALKFASSRGIDIGHSKFWTSSIKDTLSNVPDVIPNIVDPRSDSYKFYRDVFHGNTPYLHAGSLTPNYNWKTMFFGLWQQQCHVSYVRPTFMYCVDELIKSDRDAFISFSKDNVFWCKDAKPAHIVRSRIYSKYIEAGALDKKTARKIRSDGSEDASHLGLKALINNLDLYQNSDELLLQFTDSKYESVIILLVDSLPEYLLTSVMGTNFHYARRRLDQRLTDIETRREESLKTTNGEV